MSNPLSQEADIFLSAVLETAIDGIIIINARGEIIKMNQAALQMFQYSAHECQGNNVSMLMPTPHRTLHDHYLRHYIDTGQAKIIGIGREVQGKKKNGRLFPMRLAVSECKIGDNRFFTGIIHDLTEVYATRHAIAQIEQKVSEHMAKSSVGQGGGLYSDAMGVSRLLHLKSFGIKKSYRAEEYIQHKGDENRNIYLVESGILFTSKTHFTDKKLITNCYGPNYLVGLEDVLIGATNTSDIKALTDSNVIVIARDVFLGTIRNDAVFAELVLKTAAHQLNVQTDRTTNMAYDRVRDKVKRSLLILDEIFNSDPEEKRRPIQVSRELLSDLTGVARETLTRMLSEFNKEGLLKLTDEGIFILKPLAT